MHETVPDPTDSATAPARLARRFKPAVLGVSLVLFSIGATFWFSYIFPQESPLPRSLLSSGYLLAACCALGVAFLLLFRLYVPVCAQCQNELVEDAVLFPPTAEPALQAALATESAAQLMALVDTQRIDPASMPPIGRGSCYTTLEYAICPRGHPVGRFSLARRYFLAADMTRYRLVRKSATHTLSGKPLESLNQFSPGLEPPDPNPSDPLSPKPTG
jgi:hypothetical protein